MPRLGRRIFVLGATLASRRTATAWLSPHRVYSSTPLSATRSTAAASNQSTMTSSASEPTRQLWGGDWAGFGGRYAWPSGQVEDLPDYCVPEELREWGQAPLTLEVLSSEGFAANHWRHTTTVLPAIGCAVDNLDTLEETIRDDPTLEEANESIEATYWSNLSNKPQYSLLEVRFPVTDEEAASSDDKAFRRRWRVVLSLRYDNVERTSLPQIVSPIQIFTERQLEQESIWKGTVAEGGGLDGRRVFEWTGRNGLEAVLSAEKGDSSVESLSLPGNIEFRWNLQDDKVLSLEIGQTDPTKGSSASVSLEAGQNGDFELRLL